VINTKFSVKTAATPSVNLVSHSKSVWGLGLGAGADVKVAERWTLGVKYRYFWDQSITKKIGATNYKAKLGSHTVVGALSYNF
jgi:opacity protein-like surface antigen